MEAPEEGLQLALVRGRYGFRVEHTKWIGNELRSEVFPAPIHDLHEIKIYINSVVQYTVCNVDGDALKFAQ